MTIRPIEDRDLPQVLDMVNALTAHHDEVGQITTETLARDTSGPVPWVHVLVAEGDARLDGYIALIPLARFHDGVRTMDLHNLYVRDGMRGTGMGRALIDAAIAYAKERGCQVLWVGTSTDNTDAQNLYLHCGFERFDATNPRFGLKLS